MLRGESCTVTERTLTCTLGNKFTVDLLIFRTASEHVLLTFFPILVRLSHNGELFVSQALMEVCPNAA